MRFLIHVSTNWCGMDQTYRAEADSEMELWDIAEQLAYENFQDYSCDDYIAEECDYYSSHIEEFDGDDKEWEEYGGEIYGKD